MGHSHLSSPLSAQLSSQEHGAWTLGGFDVKCGAFTTAEYFSNLLRRASLETIELLGV